MDALDAKALSIPHIVLASKDEPADAVAAYTDHLAQNGREGLVETYSTMWHGWMGARANLEKEDSRAEYTRGFRQLNCTQWSASAQPSATPGDLLTDHLGVD
ncbi:hypothetical protein N7462_001187 [Penicillium macrosclerotiorum]|uniref:uncharacterized protein n=1 Tax=Penicillium macrosclerotiorum TaxID=303699 RepID=UPI00254667F3|nr:uncharacterized protein N7462_001187 [Penicillium macrosclerotiorum]KAJ5691764.1 hypothetical protein N7462_001187 [Penicillium macrosclerotiorum]